PSMVAVLGIDERRHHAYKTTGSADTAFKNIWYAEGFGGPPDVLVLASEGEGGRARGDLEVGDVGQKVDELLGQTVAEVVVDWVAAHVGEREHGDGWALFSRLDHGLFECGGDVCHRLETIARLLGQAPAHDPFKSRGNLQRRRLFVDNRR